VSVVADLGSDLVSPWGLARLADGSALVSERDTGRIVQVATDGSQAEIAQIPQAAMSERFRIPPLCVDRVPGATWARAHLPNVVG
jgi:hypothetical protein